MPTARQMARKRVDDKLARFRAEPTLLAGTIWSDEVNAALLQVARVGRKNVLVNVMAFQAAFPEQEEVPLGMLLSCHGRYELLATAAEAAWIRTGASAVAKDPDHVGERLRRPVMVRRFAGGAVIVSVIGPRGALEEGEIRVGWGTIIRHLRRATPAEYQAAIAVPEPDEAEGPEGGSPEEVVEPGPSAWVLLRDDDGVDAPHDAGKRRVE